MARVIIGPSHPVKVKTGSDIVPVYITIADVRFKEQREDGSYVYTIVMTNGAEFDFVAPIGPEGVGIENVHLNADYTLTIILSDGTEYTTAPIRGEKGETGVGIANIYWIDGAHRPGTYDTYRIIYTDSTTYDFQVYNGADGKNNLKFGTKAEWDAQSFLIAEKDVIYIYTDARTDAFGSHYPDYKIGNGIGYLYDLPFANNPIYEHMNNTTVHITQEEREFWNNKVRTDLTQQSDGLLIFTTE